MAFSKSENDNFGSSEKVNNDMTPDRLPHLASISVHHVGNQHLDENLTTSDAPLQIDNELRETLAAWLSAPLKTEEYYQLDHESNLDLNEVYSFAQRIFDDPNELHEQSVNLAKHLFSCSTHPNIKGGEFYTVYFQDCLVEGHTVDAVGLFKSENKDTFLKVQQQQSDFNLERHIGINIKKLDKGCLIYDLERDDGFVVSVVDNTNKGEEARYWKEDFLGLKARSDEYHHTSNVLSMCQDFIKKELPQNFEVSKADQADLLNRSAKFFKEQERFNLDEFTNSVIGTPDVIDDFSRYKQEREKESGIPVDDGFEISPSAVKQNAKGFKSVLKLDKNFHIYIHGNREMIERGEDQFGRKFYKVYFEEES